MEFLLQVGLSLAFLLLVYFIGNRIEKRHFQRIASREKANAGFPVTNFEAIPEQWQARRAELVGGSVVVSLDYIKRFVAGLRALFGGRIRSYEPLLDRGRREAVLRMIESARRDGFNAVINVRIETSRLANSIGNGEGTAGIEILAFGTGLVVERE